MKSPSPPPVQGYRSYTETEKKRTAVPAKAGTQGQRLCGGPWMPAFAGKAIFGLPGILVSAVSHMRSPWPPVGAESE